jgi:hypothetical protein
VVVTHGSVVPTRRRRLLAGPQGPRKAYADGEHVHHALAMLA